MPEKEWKKIFRISETCYGIKNILSVSNVERTFPKAFKLPKITDIAKITGQGGKEQMFFLRKNLVEQKNISFTWCR